MQLFLSAKIVGCFCCNLKLFVSLISLELGNNSLLSQEIIFKTFDFVCENCEFQFLTCWFWTSNNVINFVNSAVNTETKIRLSDLSLHLSYFCPYFSPWVQIDLLKYQLLTSKCESNFMPFYFNPASFLPRTSVRDEMW